MQYKDAEKTLTKGSPGVRCADNLLDAEEATMAGFTKEQSHSNQALKPCETR
jgi:hypothetical protein